MTIKSLIVVLVFVLASPLCAQQPTSKVKEYDVGTGQLTPKDIEKINSKAKETKPSGQTAAGLKHRTSKEIDRVVHEVASGYRSICCPYKSLDGADNCQSYRPQMAMIEFLAEMGYEHDQIDSYMVHGGPPELRNKYHVWLASWLIERKVEPTSENLREYFSMPSVPGKEFAGLGWDQGWGEFLHEAPRATWLYVILAIAGMGVFTAFFAGLRVLSKQSKEKQDTPDSSPNPQPVADLDARIHQELREMGDEEE